MEGGEARPELGSWRRMYSSGVDRHFSDEKLSWVRQPPRVSKCAHVDNLAKWRAHMSVGAGGVMQAVRA